jgi:hypothetical protein
MNPFAYLAAWQSARRRRAFYGIDRMVMNDVERARWQRQVRTSASWYLSETMQLFLYGYAVKERIVQRPEGRLVRGPWPTSSRAP